MGAGGRVSAPSKLQKKKKKKKNNPHKRVPNTKPPFTLGEIKKCIPPHCFNRSLLRSSSYLFHDLAFASVFYYIASNYIQLLPTRLTYIAWPVYWLLQGCIVTGVWEIAHECGHQAFSDYQWINDSVGLILHSAILVPYFSWKYSHRRHHSSTCSLEHDEVFVPRSKSQVQWYHRYFNNPLGRIFTLALTLLLGWPLYLAINASGHSYDRFTSHYDPYGPIYSSNERLHVYISDAVIMAAAYALYRVAIAKGVVWLVCIYGMPLLVANAFLVTLSYLHHTHPSLPHYDSSEWDWLR